MLCCEYGKTNRLPELQRQPPAAKSGNGKSTPQLLGRLETGSRKRNNFAKALSQNIQMWVLLTHRQKSSASMNGWQN